jgi:vitamin B12 transporter
MFRILLTLLLFLSIGLFVQAQEKELILPDVSVLARKNQSKETKDAGRDLDSLAIFGNDRNLNNGLGFMPGVSLKNYGPSGISSLSVRGTGPGHTVLCWKGIPVNNPMLGQSDASLVAGPMLEKATLTEGGPGKLAVSENFGGILHLGLTPKYEKDEIRTGFSAGSFSSFQQWISIRQAMGKSRFGFRAWNQEAQNNYRFREAGVLRTQTHAYRQFRGFESSIQVPLRRSWSLETSIWTQKCERELPPSVWEENSEASQTDESQRILVQLRKETGSSQLLASTGCTIDQLNYRDPKSGIDSRSRIISQFHWLEGSQTLGQWTFNGQVMVSGSKAIANFYEQPAQILRLVGLASAGYKLENLPLQLHFTTRAEQVNYTQIQRGGNSILPSVSAVYSHRLLGEFRTGWHQKSRFPTLNDLFWPGSGNPQLQPERGFTSDLSWKKAVPLSRTWKLNCDLSFYRTEIKKYIQWLPSGSNWTPSNVGDVEISGLVAHPEFQFSGKRSRISAGYEFSFCRSVLAGNRFSGDESKGKQLIYTPVFQSGAHLSIETTHHGFRLWMQHTGQRNIDPSGSRVLKGFTLFNARYQVCLPVSNANRLKIFLEGQNLTAVSYQMVTGFPMPLRQFSLGLEMKFQ